MMVDLNSLSTGKCLKCNFYFLPPIYKCPKEHILCNNCTEEAEYMQAISSYSLRRETNFKSVTKVKLYCGLCSCFYFNDKEKRDLKLEKLVHTIKYQCIYHCNGCQFKDFYPEIETHIGICNFIIKRCCWKNCLWSGVLFNMKNHLIIDHPILKANQIETFKNNWTYTFLLKENYFLIKTLFDGNTVKFFVFYYGEPDKYIFEIHLGTKTEIFVKIRRVIKHMINKTSFFDFKNSDIFIVELNFIAQYVRKPQINCGLHNFCFRVNVTEIEELKKKYRERASANLKKKLKGGKNEMSYQV
ncbi:hypothetical protein WA026_020508 [Henosepilachna vigintioctopunctata]|uniref:SIAH-type domain-containing protein n=1 Tax=Henosepilachna vigintioctopunctata TaxID=420089 RepID=A0AAW1VBE7_9CUCU